MKRLSISLTAAVLAISAVVAYSQSNTSAQSAPADPGSAMHWRQIGPTRAGRARAVSGVANSTTAYIGFDNGGVWRSTDYGSTWTPIFDQQSTGSIGAIAVAPSDPNVIYVGSGAGIIRPDLSTGDGLYKSTNAGKTWSKIGLPDSQMIAAIDVDPKDANRFFVAVLGHPYGPNAERGIFRSTDGGRTLQKVLYKDEYTSGNDVHIDPSNPNTVYASLWVQQQSYIEGGAFGGTGGGMFKSTDGGTTWKQMTDGLPDIIQSNFAISTSNPKVLYAAIAGQAAAPAGGAAGAGAGGGGRGGGGGVGLYKSVDGGDHWFLAVRGADGKGTRAADNRPLARIGGGDLPTIHIDPKNDSVVYSCSTVFWRSEDAGMTWTAVRGAPGGDDYQKLWINPLNPDVLVLVSDQGGVISANRGASWSNWYTQPTAAMYHASADNAFPYRVCSGQQDSGSACVDSRGNDGEITFREWHPVGIQEYGEAAPDPKNPDLVYGSSRNNVTLYNRKTGQIKNVGPNIAGDTDASGKSFARNVRTQPIEWSPIDNTTMFYAQNAVWRTRDGGKSWTRISGDLTRQTWDVPANTGKYGASVTPSPAGSITALSPSPLDINTLWAGSDDGQIQVMTGAAGTWTNVTPSMVKPWARVFNIEAGHFSPLTAYAAVNTMRLDDLNPHFIRTRDGGKTWTEINNGIARGAVSNSIREDPKQKGLLYAATDTQVWVSFDDGDHWQSLRNDMPAVSVRDLLVKDDAHCLCSDLIASTHGRGFWILDDVTPLRAAAEIKAAESARAAYLVKPATAVRVRFGMNPPTPWPIEVPAGENPPPGAILDYYLGADSSGPVTIEILGAGGKVMRTLSSNDLAPALNAASDPVAYNKVCQDMPNAADCSVPLYWAAPPMEISTKAGMHRIWWDMHYEPLADGGGGRGGGGGGGAAVPHRSYSSANAPFASPGAYSVRLTVNGKSYTQPLTVKLDPRVTLSPIDLATLTHSSDEMYNGAVAARAAADKARALSAQLATLTGDGIAELKTQVDALTPAGAGGGAAGGRGGGGRAGGAGGGRGGGAPAAPGGPTLPGASAAMFAAAMSLQAAEAAPTSREMAAIAAARAQSVAAMQKWNSINATVTALNVKRKAAGLPLITMGK
jgi:photosystem II stability/assembly factor-like uncharacterized protein